MLILTTNEVPGHRIEKVCGLVQGSTVRSKHLGTDFLAGLKTLVGGELGGYTEMLEEARQEALQRMIADARAKGANAIVGSRLTTSAVMAGAAEILSYGTAVQVVPLKG